MKKTILTVAVLPVLSLQAMADTPDFNFIEAGYVSSLGDTNDIDGFEIKGNFELSDDFYINAGYSNSERDGSSIELNSYTLGLGYKTNISAYSTLFTQFDYVRLDNNVSGFRYQDGYQVGFGIRSNISNSVEVKVAGYYRDIERSDTFFQLGAVYNLTDSTGIYVDVETDIDDNSYSLGVRFLF